MPSGLAPSIPESPQIEWFLLNIDAVQPQMPYELLPVFVLQLPEDGRPYNQYPYRAEPLRLDEGSHFSYAIQWFMFAAILGVGYLFLIQYHETRTRRLAEQSQANASVSASDAGHDESFNSDAVQSVPKLGQPQGHA